MAAIDNIRALCARGIYSNTPESALPQTAVAHMIDAFLASPDAGAAAGCSYTDLTAYAPTAAPSRISREDAHISQRRATMC